MTHDHRPYRGRFAPSPTGDLHFGSLVAATASYLEARAQGGRWLVRIDDIDPPREVEGSAQRILRELERLGMTPDEDVLYQSTRTKAYEQAVERLLDLGQAYWCGCSRSDLPPSGIYPGTCRAGLPPGRKPRAVRLKVGEAVVEFVDQLQGRIAQDMRSEVGDFVIWRADGLPAYQLAVVLDDAEQGISHIVRGADLLDSTPRQILVQEKLGLPTPRYAHVPVVLGRSGAKLSKRLQSDPISESASSALDAALRHLGHQPPAGLELDRLWAWAFGNWNLDRVPGQKELPQTAARA